MMDTFKDYINTSLYAGSQGKRELEHRKKKVGENLDKKLTDIENKYKRYLSEEQLAIYREEVEPYKQELLDYIGKKGEDDKLELRLSRYIKGCEDSNFTKVIREVESKITGLYMEYLKGKSVEAHKTTVIQELYKLLDKESNQQKDYVKVYEGELSKLINSASVEDTEILNELGEKLLEQLSIQIQYRILCGHHYKSRESDSYWLGEVVLNKLWGIIYVHEGFYKLSGVNKYHYIPGIVTKLNKVCTTKTKWWYLIKTNYLKQIITEDYIKMNYIDEDKVVAFEVKDNRELLDSILEESFILDKVMLDVISYLKKRLKSKEIKVNIKDYYKWYLGKENGLDVLLGVSKIGLKPEDKYSIGKGILEETMYKEYIMMKVKRYVETL